MRKLVCVISLIGIWISIPMHGQSTAAPQRGWSAVQALTPGTKIHVVAKAGAMDCVLDRVDSDALVCRRGHEKTETAFSLAEIKKIQIMQRGTSAVLAGGIGAGVGIGTAMAVSKGIGFGGGMKASVAVASVGLGAVVFAPIGYFSGMIRHTVYNAP